MKHRLNSNRFTVSDNPTDEEMKIVQKGLEDHNKKHPNGELDIPTPDISLVLKDNNGNIIGGVITSMLTGIMHLEILWIDERYRGLGLGRDLVLQAERIGQKKGYSASQTWTFSFQAPDFYQNIGYKVLGIFDGYVDDITEYVLLKKFEKKIHSSQKDTRILTERFTISEDASEESRKIISGGLRKYNNNHVGELRKKNKQIQIKLIIKKEEQIIGGIYSGTTLGTMYLDYIWVDERYRGQGYGRDLLMTAERIAIENGCISGQGWALSFHSPEFFEKLGYEIFGVSDGYPNSIKEYYLIKRY